LLHLHTSVEDLVEDLGREKASGQTSQARPGSGHHTVSSGVRRWLLSVAATAILRPITWLTKTPSLRRAAVITRLLTVSGLRAAVGRSGLRAAVGRSATIALLIPAWLIVPLLPYARIAIALLLRQATNGAEGAFNAVEACAVTARPLRADASLRRRLSWCISLHDRAIRSRHLPGCIRLLGLPGSIGAIAIAGSAHRPGLIRSIVRLTLKAPHGARKKTNRHKDRETDRSLC